MLVVAEHNLGLVTISAVIYLVVKSVLHVCYRLSYTHEQYINNLSVCALFWRILSSINMGIASKEKNFPQGGKKPAVAVPRTGHFRVILQSVALRVMLISILLKDVYGNFQDLVFLYLLWLD